jgi:hypothetical protein
MNPEPPWVGGEIGHNVSKLRERFNARPPVIGPLEQLTTPLSFFDYLQSIQFFICCGADRRRWSEVKVTVVSFTGSGTIPFSSFANPNHPEQDMLRGSGFRYGTIEKVSLVDFSNAWQVIVPKKDADDKNPKSIAWIEPHGAANGKDPAMPYLVLSSPGIDGMNLKIKWRLKVEYERPNGESSMKI